MTVKFEKSLCPFSSIAGFASWAKITCPPRTAPTERNRMFAIQSPNTQNRFAVSASPTEIFDSRIPLVCRAGALSPSFSCVAPVVERFKTQRIFYSPSFIALFSLFWEFFSIGPRSCFFFFRVVSVTTNIFQSEFGRILLPVFPCVGAIFTWVLFSPFAKYLPTFFWEFLLISSYSGSSRRTIPFVLKPASQFTVTRAPFWRASPFGRQWIAAKAQHAWSLA